MLEQINTETSLNHEDSAMDSKREMVFKSYVPSIFKLDDNSKENKTKKKRVNNIDINLTTNLKKDSIGISFYHKTQKNKKNKDLIKSSGDAFEGLKLGVKNIRREEDILLKKKEFNKLKREERASKSIKKSKNNNRSVN